MIHILPILTNVQLYGWVLIIAGATIRSYLATQAAKRIGFNNLLIAFLIIVLRFFAKIGMWMGGLFLLIEWYNN